MSKKTLAVAGALAVLGAIGSGCAATEDQPADKTTKVATSSTAEPDSTSTPEPRHRETPEPDGEYTTTCDYVLGDFNDLSENGFRFVAGGRLRNTGNVGIKIRFTATWEQLGQEPIRESKTIRLARGKSRRVSITVPATGDQIDLHQSADGDCRTHVTMVDTFGSTPFED